MTGPHASPAKHMPGLLTVQERKDGMGALPNRNSLEIVEKLSVQGIPCGEQVIVGKHTGIDCLTPENAARLVACWNACANIETADIDDIATECGFLGMIVAVSKLAAERAELRAANAKLREALQDCLLRDDIADDELGDMIRTALGEKA